MRIRGGTVHSRARTPVDTHGRVRVDGDLTEGPSPEERRSQVKVGVWRTQDFRDRKYKQMLSRVGSAETLGQKKKKQDNEAVKDAQSHATGAAQRMSGRRGGKM